MLAHSAKQTRRVNAFGGERGGVGADRGAVGVHNQKGPTGGAEMGAKWAEEIGKWQRWARGGWFTREVGWKFTESGLQMGGGGFYKGEVGLAEFTEVGRR